MNPTDPLDQLRDIHLPDPVDWWPPAPGWWLLLLLAVIAIGLILRQLILRHRARAYRRAAALELEHIIQTWQRHQNDLLCLQQINKLLKRVALQAFPRTDVASLYGDDWARFLDLQWQRPPAAAFADTDLAAAVYSQQGQPCDVELIRKLTSSWLDQHRATA
jgi:hypothetical protein